MATEKNENSYDTLRVRPATAERVRIWCRINQYEITEGLNIILDAAGVPTVEQSKQFLVDFQSGKFKNL